MDIPYDRYSIDLNIDLALQRQYYTWLSQDECDRVRRLLNPQHQRDFIAARGALRWHLAQYLNCDPKAVKFEYGPHGKPTLTHAIDLHFNLAHSHQRALIVVCPAAAIGVDLEKIRPIPKLLALTKRFFNPSEYETITSQPEVLQPIYFYTYWTCKEAYLKATGTGLSQISQLELQIDQTQVNLLKTPCHRRFTLTRLSHPEIIQSESFKESFKESFNKSLNESPSNNPRIDDFIGAVAIETIEHQSKSISI